MLIAFIAIGLTVWTQWMPAATPGDEWLRDRFIVERAGTTSETRIAVVDIDEASMGSVGAWPWPRARMADLVENLLGHYGARGVALDFVFPESADKLGDTRLSMLAQHAPVVLAQVFDFGGVHQMPLRVGVIGGGAPYTQADALAVPANGYIANHAELGRGARIGNIGLIPDPDGVIRRLPVKTQFEGRVYSTLSLALFECCAARKGANGQREFPPGMARSAGLTRVPYSRDWSAFTVAGADEVLNKAVPREVFAGKLVLIGSSSLSVSDRVPTPLDKSTSGLLIHATALSSMLDAQEGNYPAPWPGKLLATAFAVIVALIASYTFPRLPAVWNTGFLLGASLLWVIAAYFISA
ncbi:MAG TPA: CHASE2 domain-containing protein, partial [Burkholderiaceae bacterium]